VFYSGKNNDGLMFRPKSGVKLVAIRLEDKQQIVSEVNEAATSALSAVLADYRGVSVSALTQLRKNARQNNVYLRVVRNTLLKRAVAGTEFECIKDALVGPTILAFSMEDPGAAARVLKDFAKANDKFEIKALSIGGKLLGADQIDALATLPTYDQAVSMLMSVMLAPVTKLVQTFNEVPTKVTRAVAAVRDQKQAA
jgi:large subunit ribosomal protein L10